MKQRLYKFIFFRLLGWNLIGTFDDSIKKCVVIVIPHTANVDFFIALLVRGIWNVKINFVGKKELFVFPFGYYFRSVGGAPLDRSGGKNNVDATVDVFNKHETFRLALSPEGTRKKVTELRTGFYYIAFKANVPIIPVALDYGKKEVKVGNPFVVTGNYEEDMKGILPFFKGVKGKNPERGFEV
ncbi:1-acyl-sn-glycerol-3-phosphate acyltransferase [Flavobacterium sp. AS60]|uniref:1-acyl-sn-glycerol-3-phosphate acyltransferase n=1 Tax=Flavobacterium anseongense TaxID=2910677 RepID=UPI001F437224|nr:1-acyl-sn-glycerol-3-phosphate acyltransferase [Flavobacterium sp. AS60]MCF6130576.1 1-acyl-sn-glycerol-3-phosphate acyltransferase [Flavobacterium sp. AS60]